MLERGVGLSELFARRGQSRFERLQRGFKVDSRYIKELTAFYKSAHTHDTPLALKLFGDGDQPKSPWDKMMASCFRHSPNW